MNSIRFRIAVAVILGAAFVAASVDPAAAFVRIARQADASSPVVQAHWNDNELPLSSVIDPTNNDISPASALAIVQASAQSWQDINTSYFTVNAHLFTGAPDTQPDLEFDGQNSVIFDATGANFPTAGVIAFVRTVVDLSDGHSLDADLVFNDRDFFSSTSSPALTPPPVTPPPGVQQASVDLQAVLTHEYGHYFSLDHTSVTGSTMIPFIQNDTTQRTLELDDRAGNSTVYPESVARGLSADGVDFHATTGHISGTVVSGYNGSAIFGAHVEAFNLAAPTAANSISAISGELTLRNGQGDYTIYGLPPGNYAVRIVPLDGVNTTAADANIGGPYNGLDINFEPEFWNGAGESGNGFSDPPNSFSPIAVGAGATSSGINLITNTYPGRVIIAQHGAFENTVTFRNTGYLAVRYDPPFDQTYTIQNIQFATFTFNGVPATFIRAGLYPMNPATGLPDFSAPLYEQAPFVGNPNGINTVALNLAGTPGQTYFWAFQFPSSAIPGFPNNFPFLRMDFNPTERGLFANTYSISTALAGGVLIDRNVAVDMTCQVSDPSEAPISAIPAVGGNRRATKTEFNFLPPPNVRADGFTMAQNSLDHVDLVVRNPFAYALVASGGAGNGSISVAPSPPNTPPTIWATQAVDKNGNKSILSNAVILGLNEDASEPNGHSHEATVLTTPVVGSVKTYSPAGDLDYYQVSARPGDTIEASATATGQDGANNMDLVMLLFDNSGDLVAFNDDFTGLNPKITFVVPPPKGNSNAARKFAIQVTDFAGSAFQPTGVPQVRTAQTYSLSANVIAGAALAGRIGHDYNPDQFAFVNSGPNPANPVAKFLMVIPRNAGTVPVRLNIFDVKGRLVRTLVDRPADAGMHTAIWDGRDRDGRTVASGNYFARISAGKWQQETRVTILK